MNNEQARFNYVPPASHNRPSEPAFCLTVSWASPTSAPVAHLEPLALMKNDIARFVMDVFAPSMQKLQSKLTSLSGFSHFLDRLSVILFRMHSIWQELQTVSHNHFMRFEADGVVCIRVRSRSTLAAVEINLRPTGSSESALHIDSVDDVKVTQHRSTPSSLTLTADRAFEMHHEADNLIDFCSKLSH